jgi:putative ATP-dependent endonuclease of the OLD family
MKLAEVHIENFRSFLDETIRIDDYTCLVGPNGSGKSTLLMAINVFFRNNASNTDLSNLSKDDFHHGDITKPVKITLTFENLSAEAQEDLKNYYRQGKLIVSAIARWNDNTQSAPVVQVGSRFVMTGFKSFFELEKKGAKVNDLKAEYQKFREKYKELPAVSSKDDMREALQSYETAHPNLCELAESSDEFYGFTRGSGRLSKYIQWVYIPAVKDAATEQDEGKKTALGQLLERTVRTKVDFQDHINKLKEEIAKKYEEIIFAEKGSLTQISESLTTKLQEWSHPRVMVDLNWNYDREKAVSISQPIARATIGEDNFIGEVSRLGHGLQRAFLVTLLQELSMAQSESVPKLILGFEEPELYQHPPQARHMQNVLEKLSSENSQIIVTTHSPYFVPGKGFENVRMTHKEKTGFKTIVRHLTLSDLENSIASALGEKPKSVSARIASIEQIMQPSLKELFFTSNAIFVEGVEEVAFLFTYLELLNLVSDFRASECHFITVGGKTNMSRPLAVAKAFSINTFAIFDGDNGASKKEDVEKNRRDNSCLLNLIGLKEFDPLSKDIIWGDNVVMWPTNIRDEIELNFGQDNWDKAIDEVKKENDWEEISKKNALLIAATVEKLWSKGIKSSHLEQICSRIIEFAKSSV